MRNSFVAAITVTMTMALGLSTAIADDWTAVRLRGGVFALENGAWTQLLRGSVVPDDRVIKSAPDGRITLVRGAETIELGPDTTAQIADQSGFTTVYNHEGTVGVDAEARNVQHFAVQTPFLAAVVKGTAFTVQTSPAASTVTVARGTVEVDDEQNDTSVSVSAGEQVSSSEQAPITAASVIAAPPSAPEPPAPAAQQPSVTQVNPATANPNGNGNSGNSNAGGNGNGNSGNSNAGGNGNGNSGNSNAGGYGNSNAGGNGNGNSGNSNAGGNGNSNAGGNGNGNSGNSNSGGNGNGNNGNGNGGGNDNGKKDGNK
ncbi:MAG: FecR domain-containing protein [Pseudomonas sp.]